MFGDSGFVGELMVSVASFRSLVQPLAWLCSCVQKQLDGVSHLGAWCFQDGVRLLHTLSLCAMHPLHRQASSFGSLQQVVLSKRPAPAPAGTVVGGMANTVSLAAAVLRLRTASCSGCTCGLRSGAVHC